MLFSADPSGVIYRRGHKKRIRPPTTHALAPECRDSGGISLRVDPEPSRSNNCSHGELFWKDLKAVTSSASPQALIGASWILPILVNPSHKE